VTNTPWSVAVNTFRCYGELHMFWPLLSTRIGAGSPAINPSLLGSTAEQLRRWGYAVRRVPGIDGDYERCAAKLSIQAAMCWARLDQLVVAELVAVIPLSAPEVVRPGVRT
jgi:hypothetical protein